MGTIIVRPVAPYREVSYDKGTWLRKGTATALDPNDDGTGHADLSADMNRWFQAQPFELRYRVLRAFAAEAQCIVEKVYYKACNHCGGSGHQQVIGAVATPQGAAAVRRVCPTCRGLGKFAVVGYR